MVENRWFIRLTHHSSLRSTSLYSVAHSCVNESVWADDSPAEVVRSNDRQQTVVRVYVRTPYSAYASCS